MKTVIPRYFRMNRINRDAMNGSPYRINAASGKRHITDFGW